MSPYLEQMAIIEQELEEARDTIEDQVDEMRGIARQRDTLKAELDKAIEIISEQRKKIDHLQGSIAQYLTVIYSDHPRAQLTSQHDQHYHERLALTSEGLPAAPCSQHLL